MFSFSETALASIDNWIPANRWEKSKWTDGKTGAVKYTATLKGSNVLHFEAPSLIELDRKLVKQDWIDGCPSECERGRGRME